MLQPCEVDAGTCRRINAQLEQHSPPAWASPPNSTRPMQAVEDRLVPASSDFQAHIMAPKEVNSGKVGRASKQRLLHLIVYRILPSLVESPLSVLISFHVQQKNTKSSTQKGPLHQHNITPNARCKRFVIGISKTEETKGPGERRSCSLLICFRQSCAVLESY
jgi:hypothetical protein